MSLYFPCMYACGLNYRKNEGGACEYAADYESRIEVIRTCGHAENSGWGFIS